MNTYSQARNEHGQRRGFTLIELLMVIAIVGILASVVLSSLNSAREKAHISRVLQDLNSINTAVQMLIIDTNKMPGGYDASVCRPASNGGNDGNGLALSSPHAGLLTAEPGKFPNWAGPYTNINLVDPWGTPYRIDTYYNCTAGELAVLRGSCNAGQGAVVFYSAGPNKSTTQVYDEDNIAYVVCKP